MHRRIAVLGSTGSIGRQSLDVARHMGFSVEALSANSNLSLLEEQIREFRPKMAAVADDRLASRLAVSVADCDTKILAGIDGLCECAAENDADIVVNSVVGMVGLRPTIAAIEANKEIALANKETLVAGGDLVMSAAQRHRVPILPVDSEHSAIFQCLQAAPPNNALSRIILTASGGPFFGMSKEQLVKVTAADALRHPNWNMGAKITIDSATMMNKGLEFIEAVHLFDLAPEKIDVVVHRESIIHSLVEFDDHSVLAQLGLPDMTIPIQYALTYPERYPSPAKQLHLPDLKNLTFFEPDDETFPLLPLCKRAIAEGGLKPAAANGANEQAVELFLDGKILFFQIAELVQAAMEAQPVCAEFSLDDVYAADAAAREYVRKLR